MFKKQYPLSQSSVLLLECVLNGFSVIFVKSHENISDYNYSSGNNMSVKSESTKAELDKQTMTYLRPVN